MRVSRVWVWELDGPALPRGPSRPALLALRAGLDRLQTTYCKYKRYGEVQVAQDGWNLPMSRRVHEQLTAAGLSNEDSSWLYGGMAPESISLRLIEAPAEFAVPVKQDRCARGCMGLGERAPCAWGPKA